VSTLKGSSDEDVAQWVIAAQRGSADAFRQLHRRFVAAVHGVLLSRFRPTIAEELTQECFLMAFRKLEQLREPAKFGPWIVAIARRLDIADERRRVGDEGPEIVDSAASPEAKIDAAKVLDAIGTLPQAYRETLLLRLAEGMSGPEIAAATGLTADSVRVNLHRGMKLLRDALGIDVGVQTSTVSEHE
jgi:RNA polymerase sigma-70 factor, ECF subfamily